MVLRWTSPNWKVPRKRGQATYSRVASPPAGMSRLAPRRSPRNETRAPPGGARVGAFGLRRALQREPVPEHGGHEGLDVVRRHVVPAIDRGRGLRRAEEVHGRPRARAEEHVPRPARLSRDANDVLEDG